MTTTQRPDLLDADPAEISDHLLEAGLTGVRTARLSWTGFDALSINANEGDAAIDTALAAFVPQTIGFDPDQPRSGSWRGSVPAELRPHLVHLRDYRTAVRAGTAVTAAQTQHVIADLIDAIRLLVRNDVG